MDTPICDFVKKYVKNKTYRLHMPGHKGKSLLGIEKFDLTEIDGADCLYSANGIIKKSQLNAGTLFGCHSFYSTEGSSLSIRAMLYLALKHNAGKSVNPYVLATRNAHKSFISALGLLNLGVKWIYPKKENSYVSCSVEVEQLENFFASERKCYSPAMAKAVDFIMKKSGIASNETVARYLNISVSRFLHLFKTETGMSPQRYCLKLRMSIAADNLLRGMSVEQTAELGGFANRFHFSREFRKHYGLAPGKWLKQSGQDGEVCSGNF